MFLLYNIAVYLVGFLLKIIALFNKKIDLFVYGRKNTFKELTKQFSAEDKTIWFHCASLGEFEQGRPIIESLKQDHPKLRNRKILVTFFSPSGYEVRKNYTYADLVTYLPLDTKINAKRFIEIVNPQLAIFVKYEFWPNILNELKSKNINTILVSGIFRNDQPFFKWYGTWMKESLQAFHHFFVQNAVSMQLLNSINLKNVSISGDTRFDRVFEITKQDNHVDFLEEFSAQKHILVAGSTWKKDEEILIEYINNHASDKERFIIAPHIIDRKNITNLKNKLTKQTAMFSTMDKSIKAQVLIIDSIGILTQIYSYAQVAYVGGGFGAGIHNILEPSTFGIPIVIGPNHAKFKEAQDLIKLGACHAIHSSIEFNSILKSLLDNNYERDEKGEIAKNYVENNTGATQQITSYISKTI